MKNSEIVERFANRLENAIDREEITAVASDINMLKAIAIATVKVEEIIDDLRSAAHEKGE